MLLANNQSCFLLKEWNVKIEEGGVEGCEL